MNVGRLRRLVALIVGTVAVFPPAALSFPLDAAAPVDHPSPDGRSAYQEHCAACHGVDLGGGGGPALTGDSFRQRWGASSERLLDFIAHQMPPTAPGSLDQPTYRTITSFLLHHARLPSDGSGNTSTGSSLGHPAASAKSRVFVRSR